MADAFDSNSQDVGLSLDTIEDEIRAGMVLHADRLVAAFDCEEYYACRNSAYIQRRESEDWLDFVKRPKRTSKITAKVIKTLAKGLYSPGPTRRIKNGAGADAFLTTIYEQNNINALMKQADRRATLNGYCAIQASVTGRPEKPIILSLWGAHETVVYTWPGDPTDPWAVVTIVRETQTKGSQREQRLRYEAWSRDEHRTYLTKWKDVPDQYTYVRDQYRSCFGVEAFFTASESGEPAGSGKNPYGVVPFAFAHDEPVVADFYEGGLGNALRECNAEIDRELSDLAEHVRVFMDPDQFLTGVSTSWRNEKKAGRWRRLTPGLDAAGDSAKEPKAFIIQPDLAVQDVWEDATKYVNTTLEDLDVPLIAVHVDATAEISGIAVVAKHLPLLERTKERQPLFAIAEKGLASVTLMVAGMAYGKAELAAAAAEVDLELGWPTPAMPMPTPERDIADAWSMDQGEKSLVGVVAARAGMTLDQAKDAILAVIEENKWLKSVMPPPEKLDALGNVIDPNADPNVDPNGDPIEPDDDDQVDE